MGQPSRTLICTVALKGRDRDGNEAIATMMVEALSRHGHGVFKDEFYAEGAKVYARTIKETSFLGAYANGFMDALELGP